MSGVGGAASREFGVHGEWARWLETMIKSSDAQPSLSSAVAITAPLGAPDDATALMSPTRLRLHVLFFALSWEDGLSRGSSPSESRDATFYTALSVSAWFNQQDEVAYFNGEHGVSPLQHSIPTQDLLLGCFPPDAVLSASPLCRVLVQRVSALADFPSGRGDDNRQEGRCPVCDCVLVSRAVDEVVQSSQQVARATGPAGRKGECFPVAILVLQGMGFKLVHGGFDVVSCRSGLVEGCHGKAAISVN